MKEKYKKYTEQMFYLSWSPLGSKYLIDIKFCLKGYPCTRTCTMQQMNATAGL